MIFTSTDFFLFYALVFTLYWAVRVRTLQNVLLLVASYVFYGWIHPWFCILIASSTIVDYLCGLAMARAPDRRRLALWVSLVANLGMLGVFKYFDFFADSFARAANTFGLELQAVELGIFLPVGISFYTFQTLSYTIDVYRGRLAACRSFLDFAVFVSFFPQLVAGPIERAVTFLPQVRLPRSWHWPRVGTALHLIIGGFLKKVVVADNVAVYVNEIFMLESPSLLLLLVGSLGFAVQIYGDFSAYSDIARGTARLLGFELMENFRSPYLAVSPSDFWRRWHISFSTWIRDYLYIPMGGSRSGGPTRFFLILLASLGLSGLWHGAAWNFVLWGVYHAVLVFAYHRLGMGARWAPRTLPGTVLAWALMFTWTLLGWLLFRTPDIAWLARALGGLDLGLAGDPLAAAVYVLSLLLLYSLPLCLLGLVDRTREDNVPVRATFHALALIAIVVFRSGQQVDFIYFRF
jgi:D-alanyl-lipoteichoic acid acyltransferase DltB (MBOAT superfamily)